MIRRRALTAIIPGAAVAAAALGFAVSTATASTSHPAASHSASSSQHASSSQRASSGHPAASATPAGLPAAYNCLHAQVRPGSFTLACADGNSYLAHLSWSSWTPSSASGTGTQMINDCKPYCAAGKFRRYPVDVVFWRSEPVPNHPSQRYFSRVTLLYAGARPPVSSGGKEVNGPETWTGALSSRLAVTPGQPS